MKSVDRKPYAKAEGALHLLTLKERAGRRAHEGGFTFLGSRHGGDPTTSWPWFLRSFDRPSSICDVLCPVMTLTDQSSHDHSSQLAYAVDRHHLPLLPSFVHATLQLLF